MYNFWATLYLTLKAKFVFACILVFQLFQGSIATLPRLRVYNAYIPINLTVKNGIEIVKFLTKFVPLYGPVYLSSVKKCNLELSLNAFVIY